MSTQYRRVDRLIRLGSPVFILSCLLVIHAAGGLDNGLARRPPMGWMSWGYYQCGDDCASYPDKCLNEKLIMSVADELAYSGYLEVGYEYVIVDDCWSEHYRDSQGQLVASRERFPHGMKFLADYVHARGLKFGLYGNAAATTCMYYPGSRGHLERDARSFAEWGVDYVKFDGCYIGEEELNTVYKEFGKELSKTGRPMVYSCSWPYYIEFIHNKLPNYTDVVRTCNLWRNYHDIKRTWSSIRDTVLHYQLHHATLARLNGPGHWNDPDMVLVGAEELSPGQSRVQLAAWAMLSAPVLLSVDMRRLRPWQSHLLLNRHLMSIDQDPLGRQAEPHEIACVGAPFTYTEPRAFTLWSKLHTPLKSRRYPSYSFAFLNLSPRRCTATIALSEYIKRVNPGGYVLADAFAGGVHLRNVTLDDTIEAVVPGEDVILYTLFPL